MCIETTDGCITTMGKSHDRMIPENHIIVGTCGKCGGPIIKPTVVSGDCEPEEWCIDCNAKPKKEIRPYWGPVREME